MISIVVPVYRSAETLGELHARIEATMARIGCEFETIFVEDCSGDDSWDVVRRIAASDRRVRAIRMSRNYGQHNALLCGIRAARGNAVVTLDDDLQHPPECIPSLLAALEHVDVVYGAPTAQTHGVLRNVASTVAKLILQRSMGAATAQRISALRAFRTELREAFADYRSPFVNIDVLLTWATNRFTSIEVVHAERSAGRSGYTAAALIRHTLNMTTGFSTIPLRIASLVGVASSVVGVGVFMFALVRWLLFGSVVPGFTFLASIIALFAGAQLLALGAIGEYLARMYTRAMDHPAYVVRERIEHDCEGENR